MDRYPSIPKTLPEKYWNKEFYWFMKFDGQNFRAEWNSKRGWYKFGSKNQMVDESDTYWRHAIKLFRDTSGKELDKYLRDNKHEHCIVFCEYFGLYSFAGNHTHFMENKDLPQSEWNMCVVPIDIKIDRKGFLPPDKFLELAKTLDGNAYDETFRAPLNDETINYIKHDGPNEIELWMHEGFVGKRMEGNQLIMIKVKTDWWINEVNRAFDTSTAHAILES